MNFSKKVIQNGLVFDVSSGDPEKVTVKGNFEGKVSDLIRIIKGVQAEVKIQKEFVHEEDWEEDEAPIGTQCMSCGMVHNHTNITYPCNKCAGPLSHIYH